MNRIRIFIVLALAVTVGGAFALATYRWQNTPATKVEPLVSRCLPTSWPR